MNLYSLLKKGVKPLVAADIKRNYFLNLVLHLSSLADDTEMLKGKYVGERKTSMCRF